MRTANRSRNEVLKEGNSLLTGTIAATLAAPAADHFLEDECEFLKFHGVYRADDRDLVRPGEKT